MSLPHDDFFRYITGLADDQVRYLYSIYIGEVPTPFHKPKLTRQLVHFFRQEETVQAMADLLDDEDVMVLAAVSISRPGFSRLEQLLSQRGFSSYALQLKLIHLEQRMCIYSFQEDEPRFAVNPLLAEHLGNRIHPLLLAPGVPCTDDPPPFWITPQLLACWVSLMHHQEKDFTYHGHAKKSRLGDIQRICSSLPLPVQEASEALGQVCRHLNCFSIKHNRICIHFSTLDHISTAAEHSLMLTMASCAVMPHYMTGSRDYWIREAVRFFSLTKDRAFTQEELSMLAGIAVTCSHDPSGLAESLIAYGIYQACGDSLYRLVSLSPPEASSLPIRLSSDFTIHIDACTPLKQWAELCRFCKVIQADTMIIMEMTRETVIRGLETGMTESSIIEALEASTQQPLSPTTARLMSQWAGYYHAVEVYDQAVLKTDERTSRLITRHPDLSAQITQVLAPGIFLIPREKFPSFRQDLIDAGVPYVPELVPPDIIDEPPSPLIPEITMEEHDSKELADVRGTLTGNDVIDRLMQEVPRVSGSREVQSELAYRISQRMILSPRQLKSTSKKRTMFEAGGFDYQGKIQLIKQAVSSPPAILEIRLSPEEQEPVLVSPRTLIREGGAEVVQGVSIPDGLPFSRSVGKLFSIRLIKRPLHLLERDTRGR